MQEELSRARSMLRGSESVESVIRLLDETFERLQSEVTVDAVEGSALTAITTETSTSVQSSSSTFASYSSMQQVKWFTNCLIIIT